MKLWSIITLTVFLNFMALPSIASIFDWELPSMNMVISEEETHSPSASLFEKTVPKTMNVHDFLKFFEENSTKRTFVQADDSVHLSPFLTIFSPPPEA
ncbi:hypothetical protein [Chryseobacterium sp.]|uniref:hypothetical protein n=1 Tax=Chryseobacterium sp. TaxID=1871047 RepID=UPI0011CB4764|nr:hypothetical protein [Chryseobacterium sp.]TXF76219.1 hypothetical protein FUA25_10040 [Chryseobacterium sp.]